MPQICSALEKAAVDPRVEGIAIEIGPLAVRSLQPLRAFRGAILQRRPTQGIAEALGGLQRRLPCCSRAPPHKHT